MRLTDKQKSLLVEVCDFESESGICWFEVFGDEKRTAEALVRKGLLECDGGWTRLSNGLLRADVRLTPEGERLALGIVDGENVGTAFITSCCPKCWSSVVKPEGRQPYCVECDWNNPHAA